MPPSYEIVWESPCCPLCGGGEARPLLRARDRIYGHPGEFQLTRCTCCRHVYLNPRPTAQSIGSFYPEDYAPHHLAESNRAETPCAAGGAEEQRPPWYLSPLARRTPGLRAAYYWLKESYAELIPASSPEGGRALELGCADGRFLDRLRGQGWEAVGVEPAARPARLAQARGFQVHIGVLEPGLFPPESFDAVFAWHVLEHLPDPCATLHEVHRLLKPAGWLAFSVPNFGCWEPRVFGSYWNMLQFPLHLHQFTPRTLRRMLKKCDFELVSLVHQRNLFNVTGSVGLWLQEWLPKARLGSKLLQFGDDPSMWGQLLLAPWAKLLAGLRQGGRLTVLARPKQSRTPAVRG